MDGAVISSLAILNLPAKSRVVSTAWCPDKDLLVLTSRHVNLDRMSLWKMQGTKVWEIDMTPKDGSEDKITTLTWGPDGQSIVVAHEPSRITFHSIQDGREERSLDISVDWQHDYPLITSLFWFRKERKNLTAPFPDLLKRGGTIPGSAPSILKLLPLLDALTDDAPSMGVDQFVFRPAQPKPSLKTPAQPESIARWPSFPIDPLLASIKPLTFVPTDTEGDPSVNNDSNVESLLVAVDKTGRIFCFMDGFYYMGVICPGPPYVADFIIKDKYQSTLYAYAERTRKETLTIHPFTSLFPIPISLPLLDKPFARHVATHSSIARQLLWYGIRFVREMQRNWMGEEGHEGVRDVNSQWFSTYVDYNEEFDLVKNNTTLEARQTTVLLEITTLLTTGRETSALADYLGSNERTSERGLQRWETTVLEALGRICHSTERCLGPALQRLHLILEDVKGWSMIPEIYHQYSFSSEEMDDCLKTVAQAIILSSWLAGEARRQQTRFQEFMAFIRYEVNKRQTTHTELLPGPKHDVLEVNEYLMSGLVNNPIDSWFQGPPPCFELDEFFDMPKTNGKASKEDLLNMLKRANEVLGDKKGVVWPPKPRHKNLSHMGRNLVAVIDALAKQCRTIFERAASAVSRTAQVDERWVAAAKDFDEEDADAKRKEFAKPRYPWNMSDRPLLMRQRAGCEGDDSEVIVQYLAVRVPSEDGESRSCRELLLIIRTSSTPSIPHSSASASVAVIECTVHNEVGSTYLAMPDGEFMEDVYIMDMAFFDEKSLVVVYRLESDKQGPTYISLMDYDELEYHDFDLSKYDETGPSREHIISETLEKKRVGELSGKPFSTRRKKLLAIAFSGPLTLAVNGRVGRRVACVMDGEGMEAEVLDMEADDGDEAEGDASLSIVQEDNSVSMG